MKTEIPLKHWVRIMQPTLLALGLFSLMHGWWWSVAVLAAASLLLLGDCQRVAVTRDYLQVATSKMLFKEMTSVRSFLGRLWVYDEYGDCVCIFPLLYSDDVLAKITAAVSLRTKEA